MTVEFTCKQENKELVITGTFRIPATYVIEGKRNGQKQTATGTLLSIDTQTLEYMVAYDIKRRMQNAILPKGLGNTSFIAENEELKKAAANTQTAEQAAREATERTIIANIKTLRKSVGCDWAQACKMLGVSFPEPEND